MNQRHHAVRIPQSISLLPRSARGTPAAPHLHPNIRFSPTTLASGAHPSKLPFIAFSLATRHSPLTTSPITPLSATLTSNLQNRKNPVLLSPLIAVLTTTPSRKSNQCHSYAKQGEGGGDTFSPTFPAGLTLLLSPTTILTMYRHRLFASKPSTLRGLIFFAALLFIPLGLSAQTADDIITKYIAARGGLANIRAIQTERLVGTMVFTPTVQGPLLLERERPLKMHMEFSLGDQTFFRVYDGKSAGWVYNPFTPNPAVEPMSASELNSILDDADFEGPFINYQSKGNQVEFAGKVMVEGKPAFKLKLTKKTGEVTLFYFDASTYLLIRLQGTRKVDDKEVATDTFYRNYREVNDLWFPFLVESVTPSTGESQKIIADKIEVNVAISEAHFRKPEVPAAAADTPASAAPAADPPKPK